MYSKLIGGVLLIVGTSIGAGMLALPLATAELGFGGSIVMLVVCWAVMLCCALLFLEVNLRLPPNSNLITMASTTLGIPGQAIAWTVYMFLLYSILSAYIAGGGDLVHYILTTGGLTISYGAAAVLFTLLFGLIVYLGIRIVDYANRFLMFGKMGSYLLLVLFIFPFISIAHLSNVEFKHIITPSSITITIASFTSMMIIPSLRTYFNEDIKLLRKAVIIGTTIPLLCYIAWDAVIMGVIPLNGSPGLLEILRSSSSTSGLVSALTTILQKENVTLLAKFFTSICMVTSFLSIGLCLSDCLSDSLRLPKQGYNNLIIYAVTFLPPVLIVLFYPNAFLIGLNYAGLCCIILMVLFPPLMAWQGRNEQALTQSVAPFQMPGGKILLSVLVIFATLMTGFSVLQLF